MSTIETIKNYILGEWTLTIKLKVSRQDFLKLIIEDIKKYENLKGAVTSSGFGLDFMSLKLSRQMYPFIQVKGEIIDNTLTIRGTKTTIYYFIGIGTIALFWAFVFVSYFTEQEPIIPLTTINVTAFSVLPLILMHSYIIILFKIESKHCKNYFKQLEKVGHTIFLH